ncbi:efflux RND transporter periplasmic adaptor subunit [Poseidonocella sedimentorum]|uniref:Membrane fusion protein, multidrug efflux system n=1 Tax=Poseidonocella sedimentorum TaxID=871652 RepID=A0A1I6EKV5_9RHOB|nr:efflux RND transporter periplasmic adaptor subunit [Poseidonocella sedimentorum]SFR18181.1 membrane fusion protein, multidrug efflux system [Poseidonocella sedimentorum]
MKPFPLLVALLAAFVLYLLVFEREMLAERVPFLFGAEEGETAEPGGTAPEVAPDSVAVVAQTFEAREIDGAVRLRGETAAARQVELRAETSGQVISEPRRKGAFVEDGALLCEIDIGTRQVALAEARARLAEARARVPEAQSRIPEANARVEEARALLAEAEINANAAARLVSEGFASETRVAATRAAVRSAEATLSSAQSGLEAAKAGVESTTAGIQSAEAAVAAAQKELDRLQMRAPFAGLLESDSAELGSLLQPGSLCATVLQLDPIKLVGFVPETEVDRVSLGAQAAGRLSNGRTLQGDVTFISRSADPTTRTFRVEIDVPNPDLSVRDGQTAEILISAAGAKAHLIPQSALTLDDEGRLGIRYVDAGSTARFAPVTVLRDTVDGIWVEGLPETVKIITLGQEYVEDGVPVAPHFREAKG